MTWRRARAYALVVIALYVVAWGTVNWLLDCACFAIMFTSIHAPIPWTSEACTRAVTVHLGGTFDEIAASERALRTGRRRRISPILSSGPVLSQPIPAPLQKQSRRR